jgi:DNA-binding FrmR family transcriptional regulator
MRVSVKVASVYQSGAIRTRPILGRSMSADAAATPARTDRRRPSPARGYEKDRAQLLRRLARIEGQVRGITRMIERDEYCIDVMQQTAALRAAVDSVTLLLMEDHVSECLARGTMRSRDSNALAEEVMEVVRRTMGRPARPQRPVSD